VKYTLSLSEHLKNKIQEIVDLDSDPFYLYDSNKIKQTCQKFLDIPYSPKAIHFAMMANSTPQFIKIIKEAGLSLFINSIMHLDTAQQLGFTGKDIIYAASAMEKKVMLRAHTSGALVILDSLGQFNQWCKLLPDSPVGLRCNIGDLVVPRKTIAGYFIGKDSRLGLTTESIEKLTGDPRVIGLHIYVGTNILDIDYFLACYRQIVKLSALFPKLQFLDFGGGFGLFEDSREEFDVKKYGSSVSRLMNQLSEQAGHPIKLFLEPGRIIGGDAGYFICKVVDIKECANQQLIGVNASCVQFPRPLFYPDSAFHPISIIHKTPSTNNAPLRLSSVYGCSTYSQDFLARNVQLPNVAFDDIVVLGYAGSYCATAHTSFLGFPTAKEYFL